MSIRLNAQVIEKPQRDGDYVHLTWRTDDGEVIDSSYAFERLTAFTDRLKARDINMDNILATKFSVVVYDDSNGEAKVRPQSIMLASEIKQQQRSSGRSDFVFPESSAKTKTTSAVKVIPNATVKTAPTAAVVSPTTVSPPSGIEKSFRDKNWASKMGKIGANKYQNTLALKRAQEPLTKIRERIESLKLNCSPSFIETCNQFNSLLNVEIRNLEK